ncbi:MAG: hypothetical protein ACOX2G_03745 [Bacillota bacterium]|jgi:hypothetical protein
MKSFWLELKSVLKNFKFLALILVLLAYQAMIIAQFHQEEARAHAQTIRSNDRYLSENTSWVKYWGRRHAYYLEHGELMTPNYTWQTIQDDLAWYQYERDIAQGIAQAYLSRDWAAYNRNLAKRRLLEWNLFELTMGDMVTTQEFFGEDWEKYADLVDVSRFQVRPYHFARRLMAAPLSQQTVLSAAYHLKLLEEGLPPESSHSTSPWGFTFNFLRRGLPNVLAPVVLLMTVTLLHRDKKSGYIKTALQNPRGRPWYLARKISLGFAASSLAVAIPQALVGTILGIGRGFRGLTQPVLIDNGFLSWFLVPEHVQYSLKARASFSSFGLSLYQVPWNQNYSTLDRLDIIPLWQFLGLALIFLAVFILFCSALAVFISVLIKNETMAQLTGVGVYILGSNLGSLLPGLKNTPWDLFAQANVIPLLEGSFYSTYIFSLTVLLGASALFLGLSLAIFRRQDIH